MTQTTARINQAGKHFEIIVDLDKAINFKKTSTGSAGDFLEIDEIFSDSKKGMKASSADLMSAFGTEDVLSIAEKIVKTGEVLVTQNYRDEEREKKVKQVVDFLVRNSIDPGTGNPHTPERIKIAIEQAHVVIKNTNIESQIKEIVEELSKVIPIRIQTKKIKLIIPAIHTGKAYGLVNQYKEEENWLPNGDLEIYLKVPAGIVLDFYDKVNSATQGSVVSEEIKE